MLHCPAPHTVKQLPTRDTSVIVGHRASRVAVLSAVGTATTEAPLLGAHLGNQSLSKIVIPPSRAHRLSTAAIFQAATIFGGRACRRRLKKLSVVESC